MAARTLTFVVVNSQHIAVVVFSVVATLLFSRTLYVYSFCRGSGLYVNSLSRCMISYIVFNIIGLVTSVPYYVYKLLFIDQSSPEFELWISTIGITYLGLMPFTVFFLALERCLAIQFRLTKKVEKILFATNITSVLGIIVVNFVVRSFGYRAYFFFVLKVPIGVFNTCACGFLIWKLRKFKSKNANNVKNTIVKFTCITELILEFLPNLVASIIILTVGIDFFDYTGSFCSTTQCLNVMICAIVYSRTLHSKNEDSTVVSTETRKIMVQNGKHGNLGPPAGLQAFDRRISNFNIRV
ncbi:hypothetical protein Ddc_13869 [Ditylenchus destructor]|nr:hypothetical protein Ddc_13869 [Ditylenchus destructor]